MAPIGFTFAGTQYVSPQLLALLASPSVIALEHRNDELPVSVDDVRESTVNCFHLMLSIDLKSIAFSPMCCSWISRHGCVHSEGLPTNECAQIAVVQSQRRCPEPAVPPFRYSTLPDTPSH